MGENSKREKIKRLLNKSLFGQNLLNFLRKLKNIWYKCGPYNIKGEGNKVILVSADGTEKVLKKYHRIPNLNIFIAGNGNTIRISDKANFMNICIIRLDRCNDANIEIQENKKIIDLFIHAVDANDISALWGEESITMGTEIIMNESNAGIIIGKFCMFAKGTVIFTMDTHSIFDAETKKLLNRITQPVVIGEHCWIGRNALLLKNTSLADNTIVGAGSVVTKKFAEPNTIIAGNPAKVIKTNVSFSIIRPNLYEEE